MLKGEGNSNQGKRSYNGKGGGMNEQLHVRGALCCEFYNHKGRMA
jgi:hypothetical protein